MTNPPPTPPPSTTGDEEVQIDTSSIPSNATEQIPTTVPNQQQQQQSVVKQRKRQPQPKRKVQSQQEENTQQQADESVAVTTQVTQDQQQQQQQQALIVGLSVPEEPATQQESTFTGAAENKRDKKRKYKEELARVYAQNQEIIQRLEQVVKDSVVAAPPALEVVRFTRQELIDDLVGQIVTGTNSVLQEKLASLASSITHPSVEGMTTDVAAIKDLKGKKGPPQRGSTNAVKPLVRQERPDTPQTIQPATKRFQMQQFVPAVVQRNQKQLPSIVRNSLYGLMRST